MKNWDKEAFDAAYQDSQGNPTYRRSWFVDKSDYGYIKTTMLDKVGRNLLTPNQSILFVGCGFGWWMEFLIDQVPGVDANDIFGIDPSPYIQANKDSSIGSIYPAKILDYDLGDPNILTLLRNHYPGNGRVDWVLSTLVLTSLQNDAEIAQFAADCDGVVKPSGNVGHIFTSSHPNLGHDMSLGMNWQPREYWSDRLGADHFLFDNHYWAYRQQNGGTEPDDYAGIWNPANGVWA